MGDFCPVTHRFIYQSEHKARLHDRAFVFLGPMRFPGADIVELYSHRWEIELGYREMKHSLQQHRHAYMSSGAIPKLVAELDKQAGQFVLSERRARSYPAA